MKIRVLGAGWYGCHIATALLADGRDVEVHEIARKPFAGASGGNPARLHIGPHYPRSHLTRAACRDHHAEFMARYGHLTAGVPLNIYAVAAHDSMVDFGSYCQLLRGEIEFVTVARPGELGLADVEGAILVGERHIVIARAREHFAAALRGRFCFGSEPGNVDDPRWDMTIDCSFCANDAESIDRFEPCLTLILKGPTDRAVTIMDGPFPSLYPWDEARGLCSLTSASLTPFSKTCRTYAAARALLDGLDKYALYARGEEMLAQMARYYPAIARYRPHDWLTSIRAMPRSAADARLVDVARLGARGIRVRAGKIDAIFHAERMVKDMLRAGRQQAKAALVA